MTLTLTNGGPLPVAYTTSAVRAAIGPNWCIEMPGADQGSLAPGKSVDVTRSFTLFAPAIDDLRDAGAVEIEGSLDLKLVVKCLLRQLEADGGGGFRHTVRFD